jgi:hypothetical protein
LLLLFLAQRPMGKHFSSYNGDLNSTQNIPRKKKKKKTNYLNRLFLSFFFPRRELDKRVNTGKKRRNEKTVCINVYWYQTPMATTVTGHPEPTRFSPRRRDDDAYLHTRRSAKLWTSKILVGRIFSEMSMYRITSQMFLKS